MKKCFKCEIEKELTEFYKHPRMKDGRVNKCKECNRKDVSNHRGKNLEKIRKYDRERGNRQSPEYIKGWREKYPKKYKAHSKVGYEIKAGNITPESCEECGAFKSVAHHDDYDRPLKIRWLCQAHHKQWHAKNGEGKNPI